MTTYRGAGVYLFRTRRPGLIGRLPMGVPWMAAGLSLWALSLLGYPWWPALLAFLFMPRHNAYVGETTAVRLRRSQHAEGGGKFDTLAKPWADLSPSWYFIPLPRTKWLLRSVETLAVVLLWPVYNHKKNLWNPRRIPLDAARRQRAHRDRLGWSPNCRPLHLLMILALAWVALH